MTLPKFPVPDNIKEDDRLNCSFYIMELIADQLGKTFDQETIRYCLLTIAKSGWPFKVKGDEE